MPDSTVGDNVIILGNSLVGGNIPNKEMWGGNPAQFIRQLKETWVID